MQLLAKPMPASGNHQILDWFNSADKHKRTAAEAIVTVKFKAISDYGMEWLTSTDGRKQRAMIDVIQAVNRATANPKLEKKP